MNVSFAIAFGEGFTGAGALLVSAGLEEAMGAGVLAAPEFDTAELSVAAGVAEDVAWPCVWGAGVTAGALSLMFFQAK